MGIAAFKGLSGWPEAFLCGNNSASPYFIGGLSYGLIYYLGIGGDNALYCAYSAGGVISAANYYAYCPSMLPTNVPGTTYKKASCP